VVVLVALGEDAHAHLVEGRITEDIKREALEVLGLVDPGIAGGAEGEVGGSVGIGEVVGVMDAYRAMHSRRWRTAAERTRLGVEGGRVAVGGIAPVALRIGHEADLVLARAVVEAVHLDDSVAQGKGGRQIYLGKRVAGRRAVERKLEDVPLGNCGVGSLCKGLRHAFRRDSGKGGKRTCRTQLEHFTAALGSHGTYSRAPTVGRRSKAILAASLFLPQGWENTNSNQERRRASTSDAGS